MAKPKANPGSGFKTPPPVNLPPKPPAVKIASATGAAAGKTTAAQRPSRGPKKPAPGATAGQRKSHAQVAAARTAAATAAGAKTGQTVGRGTAAYKKVVAALKAARAQVARLAAARPAALPTTRTGRRPSAATAARAAARAAAAAAAAPGNGNAPAGGAHVPTANARVGWSTKTKVVVGLATLLAIAAAVYLLWPVLPWSYASTSSVNNSNAPTRDRVIPPGTFIVGNGTESSETAPSARPRPTRYIDVPALSQASPGTSVNVNGVTLNQSIGIDISGSNNVINGPLIVNEFSGNGRRIGTNAYAPQLEQTNASAQGEPPPRYETPPLAYGNDGGPSWFFSGDGYCGTPCAGVQVNVNPFGSDIGCDYGYNKQQNHTQQRHQSAPAQHQHGGNGQPSRGIHKH